MLRSYLKIALRNIRKHKGYSFIIITGLAVGKWLESGEKGEIIGIVKNYHYMPFTYDIQPLIRWMRCGMNNF